MTIQEIKKAVKEMDPNLKTTDPAYKTAILLIATANVGPTQPKLCALTRYPAATVKTFLERGRESGVLKGTKINHSGWFDKKDGGMAFWLDVLTVQGMVQRVPATKAKRKAA